MTKDESGLIDRTLELWQPRYTESLGPEDARVIANNIAAFFDVLRQWDRESQRPGGENSQAEQDGRSEYD